MEVRSIANAWWVRSVQNSRSMLIAEDEAWISDLVENFAIELGWSVVGIARTEEMALHMLNEVTPTIAVLDVLLGSTDSFKLAACCQSRGIPVLFIQAGVPVAVPATCSTCPVLNKPLSPVDFQVAIARCLDAVASPLAN